MFAQHYSTFQWLNIKIIEISWVFLFPIDFASCEKNNFLYRHIFRNNCLYTLSTIVTRNLDFQFSMNYGPTDSTMNIANLSSKGISFVVWHVHGFVKGDEHLYVLHFSIFRTSNHLRCLLFKYCQRRANYGRANLYGNFPERYFHFLLS